jgi:hypothetical protein
MTFGFILDIEGEYVRRQIEPPFIQELVLVGENVFDAIFKV